MHAFKYFNLPFYSGNISSAKKNWLNAALDGVSDMLFSFGLVKSKFVVVITDIKTYRLNQFSENFISEKNRQEQIKIITSNISEPRERNYLLSSLHKVYLPCCPCFHQSIQAAALAILQQKRLATPWPCSLREGSRISV